jgi:phospholipase/lecithinase/hemolysin
MKISLFATFVLLGCTINAVHGAVRGDATGRVLGGKKDKSDKSSSKDSKSSKSSSDEDECLDGDVGAMCSADEPCCKHSFCNYEGAAEKGVGTCEVTFPCEFENMIVFGDSLSDIGNSLEGYPCLDEGVFCPVRYANGPVAVDYIAEAFDIKLTPSVAGGTNFAVSSAIGADCADGDLVPLGCFQDQVNSYLTSFTPSKKDLHFVFFGANDVRRGLAAAFAELNTALAEPFIAAFVDGVVTQIQVLVAAGACNFVVMTPPNVEVIPQVTILFGATGASLARGLSAQASQALEAAFSGVKDSCGIDIKTIDGVALTTELFAAPEFAQFNTKDACLNRYNGPCDDSRFEYCVTGKNDFWGGSFCNCENPIFEDETNDCDFDSYMFTDEYHPTTVANDFMATRILEEMSC